MVQPPFVGVRTQISRRRRPAIGEFADTRRPEQGDRRAMGEAAPNVAGRAGSWSAAHWKTATFGWIAIALAAAVAGTMVGAKQFKPYAYANGDSRRAEEILDRAGFNAPARESVLVQSRTAKVGGGLFTAALADL